MVAIEHPEAETGRRRGVSASGAALLGCLGIVARKYHVEVPVAQLIEKHLADSQDLSVPQFLNVAQAFGFRARRVRLSWEELLKLDEKALPAIVLLRNGYAMVLREVRTGPEFSSITLQDPSVHEDTPLPLDERRFTAAWTGEVLLFTRDYRFSDDDQPMGFRFVAGLLFKDRGLVTALFTSAFILSILQLSPIIFWRVLVDRVLYSGNLDTFTVLIVAMLVLLAFEVAFAYLRRHLALLMTQRFDVKLSTYLFDKVIHLPIDYFERTPKGETLRIIGEVQRIRNVIATGIFGIVLDALVLVVCVPLMFFFSPFLTFCVVMIAALVCGWVVFLLPEVRRTIAAAVSAEINKNTFLIETLYGIRTVKALALDARSRHQWDAKVAVSADRRYEADCTTNKMQTVIFPLERLMVFGVIGLAVYLAITSHEQVYPGALFAFTMLSQRMATPLVQLAQMITQYDEAWLGVGLISKLSNQPAETGHGKNAARPPVTGRIEFSDVTFRYFGSRTPALDNVSFMIPVGTVFGLMGRSGSGKTTVTRLLQLFHGSY
jgi:ATP-binding cassette, subfamily B, bacterial HlyB/CyaB